MTWALIVVLLLLNLVQPIQPSTNPRTVVDSVYWSLCRGFDSKNPHVRKLADERCNSYCKRQESAIDGGCRGYVCQCLLKATPL
ncbi:unnamed protein product [Cylicocyclus nassatus]|uniref:Knottin scorpion toxin-like domain-containing protein n=1 Tax=Cylicocyclus nassatus TaxID=53992 RepID=A0AA36GPX8_CYLNA|nr:unnamed protein product [Cylicocyclus nassatus]